MSGCSALEPELRNGLVVRWGREEKSRGSGRRHIRPGSSSTSRAQSVSVIEMTASTAAALKLLFALAGQSSTYHPSIDETTSQLNISTSFLDFININKFLSENSYSS